MSFDEQLIELVREKKQLYDLKDLGYKNVHKKEKIWEEIGRKLNCSAEKCKKRWKGLRDTFKRSKRSLHLPSGSAPQEDTVRWKYYNNLTFLNDFEGYRRTIGSDNNYNEVPAEEYLECFSIDDPLEAEYLTLPAETSPKYAIATTSAGASTSAIAPTATRTSSAVASSSATASSSAMREKIQKKAPKTINVQAASAELKELMSSVSQVMQTMQTNNAETDTELLFLSLARKVDTANLAILDKLKLEAEVIALVTNKIKQSII